MPPQKLLRPGKIRKEGSEPPGGLSHMQERLSLRLNWSGDQESEAHASRRGMQ